MYICMCIIVSAFGILWWLYYVIWMSADICIYISKMQKDVGIALPKAI